MILELGISLHALSVMLLPHIAKANKNSAPLKADGYILCNNLSFFFPSLDLSQDPMHDYYVYTHTCSSSASYIKSLDVHCFTSLLLGFHSTSTFGAPFHNHGIFSSFFLFSSYLTLFCLYCPAIKTLVRIYAKIAAWHSTRTVTIFH